MNTCNSALKNLWAQPQFSDVEWLAELFVELINDPSIVKVIKPRKGDKNDPTLDEKKERGLYVDLSPELGLSTPEQIDAKEAERQLADLKSSLNDLRRLSRVLDSDDDWQLMVNTVQSRVPRGSW